MQYLKEAEKIHERLRLFFYPKVFEEQHADTINWSEFTPVFYKNPVSPEPLKQCFPLMVFIFLLGFMTIPLARAL